MIPKCTFNHPPTCYILYEEKLLQQNIFNAAVIGFAYRHFFFNQFASTSCVCLQPRNNNPNMFQTTRNCRYQNGGSNTAIYYKYTAVFCTSNFGKIN